VTGEQQVGERHQSLWLLAAAPAIWSLHFMACYVFAAIWCGMIAGPFGDFAAARLVVTAMTVVALAAIAGVGAIGFRRHRLGAAELPHDDDTPEDRHRFIGFSTFLLSGLSAVAVAYTGLAALLIGTCQ
jgi:hypothetical protein